MPGLPGTTANQPGFASNRASQADSATGVSLAGSMLIDSSCVSAIGDFASDDCSDWKIAP